MSDEIEDFFKEALRVQVLIHTGSEPEPFSPRNDCPWKCKPDAKVCLCDRKPPAHRGET